MDTTCIAKGLAKYFFVDQNKLRKSSAWNVYNQQAREWETFFFYIISLLFVDDFRVKIEMKSEQREVRVGQHHINYIKHSI